MGDGKDFKYLSKRWIYWAKTTGLGNATASTSCADCQVLFQSDDYSFHLRASNGWWVIDTVDDRNQRHNDTARLSTIELVEKYLEWTWASTARGALRLPRLGPQLYALGLDPTVQSASVKDGIVELSSITGKAILMEPSATIFSHLMLKPLSEIESMVKL